MLEDLILFVKKEAYLSDNDSIDINTKIENDLGVSGDDAIDLLEKFSDKYNVDVSSFEFSKYFLSEGEIASPPIFLKIIFNLFGFKPPKRKKEITVGTLLKAIKVGKLDEEVINS